MITSATVAALYPFSETAASRIAAPLPSGRGRHEYSREFVAVSQRERLIDGIARAVSEKGYKAATVADVIKAAGVSRKTFYEHFSNFEDCYLAAYDALVPVLVEMVDGGFNSVDDPWPERIRRGLRGLLEFVAHEPDFARAGLVEVLSAGPNALARRDIVMQGMAAYFDPSRHEIDVEVSEPTLVAELVVDGLYGLLYTRLARGEAIDPEALLPHMTYVALLPYLGDRPAAEFAGLRDG